MSDAMGRSKIERLYAFVQTKEGDLGEQLIRNGLARIHGAKVIPPGLSSSRPELEKLQQLEDEARQEKIGGWGINVGRLNVRAQKLSSDGTPAFTVFVRPEKAAPRARPVPHATASAAIVTTPAPAASISSSSSRKTKTEKAREKIATGKLDINTATEKELRIIPGIGPVMAARIIAARPFKSADDLKKVNGIGDIKYAKIRPYFN